jgi:hypothetical protein
VLGYRPQALASGCSRFSSRPGVPSSLANCRNPRSSPDRRAVKADGTAAMEAAYQGIRRVADSPQPRRAFHSLLLTLPLWQGSKYLHGDANPPVPHPATLTGIAPVMTRFRLFLACLLLATLPLQGLAAATMLYCGHAAKVQAGVSQAGHDQHAPAHAAAAAEHEHAGHSHAAVESGASSAAADLPDSRHKCGACAACCHSVALIETPHILPVSAALSAPWVETFVPVHSRPSPVPDKPPRA